MCFLVDTGAEVSVIPPSTAEHRLGQVGPTLQAANSTAITTFGSRSLTLAQDAYPGHRFLASAPPLGRCVW